MSSPIRPSGGSWAALGSVLAAIAASACCWLPLLLLSFGASAVGLSAAFEKLRPLFLGVSAVLLGAGFYMVYVRKEACAENSSCASPPPRLRRFNRVALWIASVAVAAFALFPNYMEILVGSSDPSTSSEAAKATLEYKVEGMTCAACSSLVSRALRKVPGVLDATVQFETALARVDFDPNNPPIEEGLKSALAEVGYRLSAIPTRE